MDEDKKTIFLTIERGMVARNLLHNDFYIRLKERYNIVIFTPLNNDSRFIIEFGGNNIKIAKLIKQKRKTKVEKKFTAIHKAIIYNPTVKIKSRYGLSLKHKQTRNFRKKIRNNFERIVFGLFLSKLKFLRDVLKKIDAWWTYENLYQDVFDNYQPVAVFISNISSDLEVNFLRVAKKNRVLSFGMTKSWDNFSKIGFREKVDHLIVWSEYMKDEAILFQNYKAENIKVVGIPQFDIYAGIKDKYARKDFINIYKLDKNKKIILFGQAGPLLSPDDPYIVGVIKDWIKRENKNYQVLIRPHFAHHGAREVFNNLVDNQTVFIDTLNNPSLFKDKWDFSKAFHLRLALSMRFCDVLITSITTLFLDAMSSGNQAICYYFD